MDFSEALKWLKDGHKATRNTWEPQGQYVVLRPGRTEMVDAPDVYLPVPYDTTAVRVRRIDPHLMLCTTSGTAAPWQPYAGDLLAVDWLTATADGEIRWPDGTVA